MPGVSPIGLRVAPSTPQPGGIGRLGQMLPHPGPGQFLDHIPPPDAALHRQVCIDLVRFRPPPAQPGRQMTTISRTDPAGPQLTSISVDQVEGDLLPMNVQPSYDGHRDLLKLHERIPAPDVNRYNLRMRLS